MASEPITPANDDDKLWAGLGYVGLALMMVPTLIIFFLKRDESAYIKFHLLQALAFGVANILIQFVLGVLYTVPILNLLAIPTHLLIWVFLFAYWITLIIWAFMGKTVRIPFLGNFVEKQFMQ